MVLGRWFGGQKEKPEASAPEGGAPQPAEATPARGLSSLFRGLAKTSKRLMSMLPFGRKLDAATLEEIETTLIQADFGPATARAVTDELRQAYKEREFSSEEVMPFLQSRLVARLGSRKDLAWAASGPTVIVVAGVNGTGKTTSIAKLAHHLHQARKKVILAAGDTFRAAAVEQLAIWSRRIGVPMIQGKPMGDPSSVVFDAVEKGVAEGADAIIIDTAGRLHTDKNLMAQLGKMVRVIQKRIPDGPHEVLQVLDATIGQNAIQQAREFTKVMPVTGLILTKLDGTARGGVVFPILAEVGLPVKFIGVGEGLDDLEPFDPESFVAALFG